MNGTTVSASSASVGWISTTTTNIPTSVSTLCSSGGIETVTAPTAEAWVLIWNISFPICLLSW